MPGVVATSVPGRVCLIGERLDFLQRSVVAMSLADLRVHVRACRREDECIEIRSPFFQGGVERFGLTELDRYEGRASDHVRAGLAELAGMGHSIGGTDLALASTLPAGAGLSSSAAVSLAVLAAVTRLFDIGLSVPELCAVAFRAEARRLGVHCGQMDQYVCGLGGLLYVDCTREPPPEIEPLPPLDDVAVILGDTRRRRQARAALNLPRDDARTERMEAAYSSRAVPAVEELRQLLWERQRNYTRIGALLDVAHSWLRDDLGRYDPDIERYVQAARDAGAFGAKLTGAGKGGFMFALAPLDRVDSVEAAILRVGGAPLRVRPGTEGIVVEAS